MHKLLVILLCAVLFMMTSCQPRANLDAEKTQIKAVLDSYITSIETENLGLYGEVMAHDQDMVNFGTSEPPIVGWDALKKVIEDQNAALSQTKIEYSELVMHVSKSGDFAWATDLWNFKTMLGDKPLEIPVRCSWILEKQDGRWVVVHFHKSVRGAV